MKRAETIAKLVEFAGPKKGSNEALSGITLLSDGKVIYFRQIITVERNGTVIYTEADQTCSIKQGNYCWSYAKDPHENQKVVCPFCKDRVIPKKLALSLTSGDAEGAACYGEVKDARVCPECGIIFIPKE
jgi:hypothetical protein